MGAGKHSGNKPRARRGLYRKAPEEDADPGLGGVRGKDRRVCEGRKLDNGDELKLCRRNPLCRAVAGHLLRAPLQGTRVEKGFR